MQQQQQQQQQQHMQHAAAAAAAVAFHVVLVQFDDMLGSFGMLSSQA
jgi:hypothetical protein